MNAMDEDEYSNQYSNWQGELYTRNIMQKNVYLNYLNYQSYMLHNSRQT